MSVTTIRTSRVDTSENRREYNIWGS